MKITLDVKTLVIGFLAGALFMCAMGASARSDSSSFGVAAPTGGTILIKTERGYPYLVNTTTGKTILLSFVGQSGDKTKLW